MNALIGRLHGCTDLILASYEKAMEHKVFFEGRTRNSGGRRS